MTEHATPHGRTPGSISELRRDAVSGEWVLIATGRAKRPHEFAAASGRHAALPSDTCPFDILFPHAYAVYGNGSEGQGDDWQVQVVPNKYPALQEGMCSPSYTRGPYEAADGVGHHEVVITRDHDRTIGAMTPEEVDTVLRAYQDRCHALRQDPCVRYISIFHNHGPQSGATIAHPHSQIIALPVVPPDIARSLAGSQAYFRREGACAHCAIVRYEREAGERVVYENEHCVVLAPFASKAAFELRVLPLRHSAYFEATDPRERLGAAAALRAALAVLGRGLGSPDYNFFLHTAPPASDDAHAHYHWHIEIIPKTAVWAGFEISTGIEISTISPEAAASFLRGLPLS